MADDDNDSTSAMPVKQRQKVRRRSNFLFVAGACLLAFGLMLSSVIVALPAATAQTDISEAMTKDEDKKFEIVEATIEDIHDAIKTNEITCTELVQQYIDRAKAYNGVCSQLVTADGAPIPPTTGAVRAGSPIEFPTNTVPVSSILPNFDQYMGKPIEFGRMEPTASDPSVQQQFGMRVGITDADQLNALETINIRGERSVTCKGVYDAHPSTGPLPEGAPSGCEEFRQQPDALERAAELDAQYGSNPPLDELPMYCIPMAFKDPWDTKDMRSTSSADANYAMDAAPEDSTVVAQLRAKGAIIYAKANSAEYHGGGGDPGGPATAAFVDVRSLAGGSYSTWAGMACNPYDTTRETSGSSSGSAISVAANLVVCSICETTGGSCRGPAGNNGVVSLVPQRTLASFGGVSPGNQWDDRTGINCRTLEDTALVLDALKDPERGYYDPRDKYTAIPDALISEEPYANFVVDDGGNNTSLAGMRVGIVREHMVKHALNDAAISDQINNEFKTIIRDKLGAELVESFDPLYPDDPDIPNMEYTFQDAFAEILPLHMPEYFSKTNSTTGDLEFAVPGWNVTTREYMAAAAAGEAPLSDDLNLRRVARFPTDLSFSLALTEYLLERGDERIKDWASLNDNSKFYSDGRRAAHENWESKVDIRSDGITEGLKMRYVLNLVVEKVMHQNGLDALVSPFNTIPPREIGGPVEPTIKDRRSFGVLFIHDIGGFPEIIVPAGFNEIVYEPQFALSANNTAYTTVTGTVQSLLPHPMPISILLWAGSGDEPTLLKVASAYEAATHHRAPPPDFGPLPSFPIEHMSNTTASAGYGVYAQKPARAEYVTEESELVGDKIDSITLTMKSVGTINGTAEIGVLNEDLSVKKLFGTLDVTTLTPTYTDYEFKLTDELYTIESGDRIGIKYEGGGFNLTSWVSVMLDLDAADPFDGANSYLQYHYQGSWQQSPDRDMHMTLQQTHG